MRASLPLIIAALMLASEAHAELLQVLVYFRSQHYRESTHCNTITIPDGRSQYVLDNIHLWSNGRFRGTRLRSGRGRVTNTAAFENRAQALVGMTACVRLITAEVGPGVFETSNCASQSFGEG